ncbi:hypothetical protein BCR43DRAFT_511745 [Syncephalastrum racemosum]|uniref:Uncharacterized protein n=1 Tax=Syncephalastrum racemosum TaxID=13706 RepID=A0A1X2HN51_SYNRA|nr:hypothetical protein BCR43DRAFT_511745 [Syncephalastrum racemosum]
MDQKKGDYVAVPTEEPSHSPPPFQAHPHPPPPPPPPPFEHGGRCCRKNTKRKAFRAVKLLLIGGAIGAFAYSKLAPAHQHHGPQDSHRDDQHARGASPFAIFEHGPAHGFNMGFSEPVAAMEESQELFEFLKGLNVAWGERPAAGCQQQPRQGHGDRRPWLPWLHQEDSQERPAHHRKHHGHHHGHHHHDNEHAENRNTLINDQFDGELPPHDRPEPPHHGPFPPPPPPPPHMGDDQPPPHGPFPPQVCAPNATLSSESTVFTFSSDEFSKSAVYLGRGFAHSRVFLSKASDVDLSEIKINVTLLYEDEHLKRDVAISAFDHDGQYVVEVSRAPPHGKRPGHPPHDKKDKKGKKDHDDDHPHPPCLKSLVHVTFPASLDAYDAFELRAHNGQVSAWDSSLKDIIFGEFKAGVGRGWIALEHLTADKAVVGAVSGHVRGEYNPAKKLVAGVIHGTTQIVVKPTTDTVKTIAAVVKGKAEARIADFAGDFVANSIFGASPSVIAAEPTDLHVEKYRHNLKAGYYKEKATGARAVVHAKRGATKLVFE